MSVSRFYCPHLAPGEIALDEAESRHALHTLRLRAGDQIELFDGRGRVALATLLEPDSPRAERRGKKQRKAVARACVAGVGDVHPRPPELTLITAACKGDRLDWLIEKGTELGVGRFALTEFERSVVHSGPDQIARLERAALEASKQSRRAWLPEIVTAGSLTRALDMVCAPQPGSRSGPPPLVVAHPAEGAEYLADCLGALAAADEKLAAVIGPEGGLTEAELSTLGAHGARTVRLAATILRVETAALAVAAIWAGRG